MHVKLEDRLCVVCLFLVTACMMHRYSCSHSANPPKNPFGPKLRSHRVWNQSSVVTSFTSTAALRVVHLHKYSWDCPILLKQWFLWLTISAIWEVHIIHVKILHWWGVVCSCWFSWFSWFSHSSVWLLCPGLCGRYLLSYGSAHWAYSYFQP